MLLGVDRARTIIAYANNDRFNPNSGGNPFAAGAPQPGAADPARDAVYRRGVVLAHQAHGLVIANLTIRNTTPKGGSQAETIILNGTPDARALLAGLDLYSFQDTVQFNGQTYLGESYIEGDVDFTWGTGPSFFEKVHACAVSNGAIFNTARCPATPPGNHGFVFKDCMLDGKPNVSGTFLARIEANRFPTSETILMNCTLSPAIAPAGWRAPTGGDASQVHFWEYNSHDAQGKPVDVSQRIAGSKQLVEPADHEAIVNYSSARYVLGGAWDPVLAPVIVALGSGKAGDEPTRLHVKAVGVPSPTVQWSRDGTALPGETGEDLVVKTPGKYAVVVTNSAGKVAAEVGAVSP
jgi:pectin methylesterase-like acyl-CoA thioesterase